MPPHRLVTEDKIKPRGRLYQSITIYIQECVLQQGDSCQKDACSDD